MMGIGYHLRNAVLAVSLLGLAACDGFPPKGPIPIPPPRPSAPKPDVKPQSEASKAIARHYSGLQSDLLVQGLLRTDGGGPDVPFSAHNLAENFIKIALYDEYVRAGGRLIEQQAESRLRRWERPVRMQIGFGDSVPLAQRAKDRKKIAGYSARLSRITGHPIGLSTSGGNFHVLVLNEDERINAGPRLRKLVPGISTTAINTITAMDRSTLCLVFAFPDRSRPSSYSKAIAIIRGEHPDLLRLSCLHEELAQGLGLANDSPAARPSIFNDDEEFGLLTRHDELLLQMLYDKRLSPGITPAQARPIVRTIANELTGGSS